MLKTRILKVDYDRRFIKTMFKYRIKSIYRVYYTKREYLPVITVLKAERSRKGWHLTISFIDREPKRFEGADVLMLQAAFTSDSTRGLFDYLRLQRGTERYNLMFDYKSGYHVKVDNIMEARLNEIIRKIHDRFALMKPVI